MKRIISLIAIVALLATMCSFSVYAATLGTLTMSTTAENNKAVQGEDFVVSTTLGTSDGIKSIGFKIAFDANDLELGISPESAILAETFKTQIESGAMTLDEVCERRQGRASYIDDTFYTTFSGYSSANQFSTKKFGYEAIDGTGYVAFGYTGDYAKTEMFMDATPNMAVGGVVLKVKTAEAKQTTITLVQASASGDDNVDTSCEVANTITLNLNGYGEVVEPEDPYALETSYVAAGKDVDVTNAEGESYKVNTALIFGSVINTGSAEVFGTEIILKGYNGSPIDLVASKEAQYNAGVDKTGFMAAITSIREANLSQAFVAKAYAVDAEGNKVYGAEKEAIFNDIAK